MAHTTQSRPDPGLDSQLKVLKPSKFSSSLGRLRVQDRVRERVHEMFRRGKDRVQDKAASSH
jgi:hypothetical protein